MPLTPRFDRRRVLKAGGAAGAAIWLSDLRSPCQAAVPARGTSNAAKLGWRVTCCAYTFRQVTFLEAIEKIAALGLSEVEGFAWHGLGKEHPGVKTNESMSAALRKETKKRLDDAGMKMTGLYLSGLPGQEAAARKLFDFAKEMEIEILVSEPDPSVLDVVGKLCDEYQIRVSIHNHPKPSSRYWNPETVAQVCRDRTRRIGCCADTGHWCRSGVAPVEALRLLEGRVISFHLKDVVKFGDARSADCPWGAGQGDIEGILKEVHRQKATPVFGIEYDRGGDTTADLRQSLAYLEKVAAGLGG